MTKMLKISFAAILAISPLMAMAAVTDAEPVHEDGTASVATDAPKYALMPAGTNDGKVATGGYVKGAYNAAIKAINALDDKIDDMAGDYSTKEGVVATINASTASVSGSINVLDTWGADTTTPMAISASGAVSTDANKYYTTVAGVNADPRTGGTVQPVTQ